MLPLAILHRLLNIPDKRLKTENKQFKNFFNYPFSSHPLIPDLVNTGTAQQFHCNFVWAKHRHIHISANVGKEQLLPRPKLSIKPGILYYSWIKQGKYKVSKSSVVACCSRIFAHGFGHSPDLGSYGAEFCCSYIRYIQLAVQCILHQNHPTFLEVILLAFMLIAFFVTFIFIWFWLTPRSVVSSQYVWKNNLMVSCDCSMSCSSRSFWSEVNHEEEGNLPWWELLNVRRALESLFIKSLIYVDR